MCKGIFGPFDGDIVKRSAALNCTLCFDIIFVHKDVRRRLEILNRYLSPIVALCACLVPSIGLTGRCCGRGHAHCCLVQPAFA